jgi:uncharacterized membrane protein YhiD involved in acid resistance
MDKALIDVGLTTIYQPQEILFNLALSFLIGILISSIYKITHKGLSYSQSFMMTLVFVTLVVSMVMMVIGNNLARAFALVGAFSIIRFRTVVKDTKDTAFVFMGLAGGMAAGTSSYFLATAGTTMFLIVAFILHISNYGSFYKSEFILIFRVQSSDQEQDYSDIINNMTTSSNLIHVEPSSDNQSTLLTFDIALKKDITPEAFSKKIAAVDGVEEVRLVASKSDVDY